MAWTNEQQQAIDREGCSLLISAAAGSGKTAVLTERIARLVMSGANIEDFLVVTFTEAATAEMKRRIAAKLFDYAHKEADTPAKAARLRAQALSAGRANISTLHKFCLYILRRNFPLLGLDPNFRPADEVQSAMLLQQALDDTAQARYEASDPAFLGLLRASGGEDELFMMVERLYRFLLAQPDPWAWLQAAAGIYTADAAAFSLHPALMELLDQFQLDAAEQVRTLTLARDSSPEDMVGVRSLLDDELSQLRSLALCRNLEEYRESVLAVEFKTLRFPRGCALNVQGRVKKARELVKNAIKEQKKLLTPPFEMEARRMGLLKPHVDALCAFIKDMDQAYGTLKREHGVVDFSDMEHMALKALSEESVRSTLRERFAYVFVDEYQDSSRIQECIIDAVRREYNLFLVGDVKQSIYRFRQADPGLFLHKLKTYTGECGNAQIHLNINFRSARPVIEAVNAVFSRVMSEKTGELDYDDLSSLHMPQEAAENPHAFCEMHVIERADAADATDEPMETDADAPQEEGTYIEAADADAPENTTDTEAEAMLAAKRIRALMRDGRCMDPKKGERPLRYSDFAVLLRSHRHAAEIFAQVFSKMGIPVYVQLTGGYFDAIEVQVFLNLLRIIDNRRQDIPLLSVLRSPVFGFTVEELIALKTQYPAQTLFERLLLCAEGLEPVCAHARETLNLLETWRQQALLLALPEFLEYLLDETGFYDCVGVLPGGRERQTNLDALLNRARDYIDAGFPCDIWSFLQFMDRAAATADLGRAQPGAADVVRVLSMHASKGLEYPVVICAGLGQRFNKRDEHAPLLCERELGLGVRFNLKGVRTDTLLRRAIFAKLWRQQLAEEMRILYVGMTRAREQLLLIGCMRDAQAQSERAAHIQMDHAYSARAMTFLHWLLPVAVQTDALPLTVHARQNALQAQPAVLPSPAQQAEKVEDILMTLRERLNWRYPHTAAASIPSKRSVSELLNVDTASEPTPVQVQNKEELLHRRFVSLRPAPSFVKKANAPLTAAQRGTAIHTALREIRLDDCPQENALPFVEAEILRMQQSSLLSPAQAQAISPYEIARFLESELGQRIKKSDRVERELEFAVLVSAEQLGLAEDTEPVLLQGVIDCCFMEDDGWVLVDYKTDHVPPGQTALLAAFEHAKQLSLYALSLQALSGREVHTRIVALLSLGEYVQV